MVSPDSFFIFSARLSAVSRLIPAAHASVFSQRGQPAPARWNSSRGDDPRPVQRRKIIMARACNRHFSMSGQAVRQRQGAV
jgi:hypothetical protein